MEQASHACSHSCQLVCPSFGGECSQQCPDSIPWWLLCAQRSSSHSAQLGARCSGHMLSLSVSSPPRPFVKLKENGRSNISRSSSSTSSFSSTAGESETLEEYDSVVGTQFCAAALGCSAATLWAPRGDATSLCPWVLPVFASVLLAGRGSVGGALVHLGWLLWDEPS